jgi:ADP-heptose:LPS heptosyltransferase
MWSAIRDAVRFFWMNATVRDPRATRRHNWRWVLFVFIDSLLVHQFRRRAARDGTLVVLVNRLGDAIVSKQLVDALRLRFESTGERFTVLGDRSWEVLADNIYGDTETHFIDERRFRLDLFYRLKIALWMRRQNYRRAICFMHHRLEMRDDALVALSGADERIVMALPFLKYRWYPWIFETYLSWTTCLVPTDETPGTVDIFDPSRNAIRRVPHALDRQRGFYATLTNGGVLRWRRLHSRGALVGSVRAYVVLSFGASNRERCWPLTAYVDLAARLVASDYDVIFIGGPAEAVYREQLVALVAKVLQTGRVSVLVNELSFDAIISLCAGAACFVGTDTGGSHLAMWLGVPLVTILHADRRLEAYHRLGDFFPYPADVDLAPYRAVWTTLDEFRRTDAEGACDRVWAAVQSLLTDVRSMASTQRANS